MTVIDILLSAPQLDGTLQPVTGWLQWTPTRARAATEAPGTLVLPIGFTVNLVGAMALITVAPTGPDWAWRVDRHVPGYGTTTTTVAVPDTTTPVAFTDLIEVDPATLTPTATPEPAWYGYTDTLAATAAGAKTAAVAAQGLAQSADTNATQALTAAQAAQQSAQVDAAGALTAATAAQGQAAGAATSSTAAAASAAAAAAASAAAQLAVQYLGVTTDPTDPNCVVLAFPAWRLWPGDPNSLALPIGVST